MRAKTSVFIATSLDGYIARKNGSTDWLYEANKRLPEGEDFGYGEFWNSADLLVIGRNTYEGALSFPEWPYERKRVIVMSSKNNEIPVSLKDIVSVSSETPSEIVKRVSAEGVKHIYVDGGITIQHFLSAGLIDEMTVTLIPVLIGEGRALFGKLEKDMELFQLSCKAYDFGYVQLKYSTISKV